MSVGMLTEEMASEALAFATALEASQGQSGGLGSAGWARVFISLASACDELKALLTTKAQECGLEISLPVLDGFGEMRTYAGRASHCEGFGAMCFILATDIAPGADAFWAACEKVGIPAGTLPTRDRGSWVQSWKEVGEAGRVQMSLALMSRGLLDLDRVASSWQPAPAGAASKQRKRA
jgi:hypothetical protein